MSSENSSAAAEENNIRYTMNANDVTESSTRSIADSILTANLNFVSDSRFIKDTSLESSILTESDRAKSVEINLSTLTQNNLNAQITERFNEESIIIYQLASETLGSLSVFLRFLIK